MKNKAIFKFNNGDLALLCSKCSVIIKTGKDFTEKEMLACTDSGGVAKYWMPPRYCDKCKPKKNE